jgi:hypothetical protein
MHKNLVTGQHVGSTPMARPFRGNRSRWRFRPGRGSFQLTLRSRDAFLRRLSAQDESYKDSFLESAICRANRRIVVCCRRLRLRKGQKKAIGHHDIAP